MGKAHLTKISQVPHGFVKYVTIDTPRPVRVASGKARKARGFLDQRVTLNRCVPIFDSAKN
ncbi:MULTISPECIES: hypothetical protein [unclassified Moorena]|uniref:hypothetical protein n=1 Tax=unclassified Moorena TaxID=2683338 RepID=UPI0013C05C46|nr:MULTISPECIES: hypothetical protein [unclassified Moorena]NEO08877.1 hypothetical protein [Moorena sp. SIO3I8]NEO21387.1 hypothetical protein [Moorena sp. SIO4A5]NEQ60389.1 hypothetical protein [Moorena sp. SIO4A1]